MLQHDILLILFWIDTESHFYKRLCKLLMLCVRAESKANCGHYVSGVCSQACAWVLSDCLLCGANVSREWERFRAGHTARGSLPTDTDGELKMWNQNCYLILCLDYIGYQVGQ